MSLDDLQGRRLACPVGTEQGVELAWLDPEREVSDRVEVAVDDVQPVDLDDRPGGGSPAVPVVMDRGDDRDHVRCRSPGALRVVVDGEVVHGRLPVQPPCVSSRSRRHRGARIGGTPCAASRWGKAWVTLTDAKAPPSWRT